MTMPAALVASQAGGTIWAGSAALPDGHRLDWRWSPLGSLSGLGFGVRWHVTGADSDLTGGAVLRPGEVRLNEAEGLLDAALLFALAEDVPFTCRLAGRVTLSEGRWDEMTVSATGTMRTGAGTCRVRSTGAADQPVPPMTISLAPLADGDGSAIAVADESGRPLLGGDISDIGLLRYRLTPLGARLLPFAAPGDSRAWVEIAL